MFISWYGKDRTFNKKYAWPSDESCSDYNKSENLNDSLFLGSFVKF